jgi:DNA repair protein RecO (recombination protein O)
LSLVTLTQEPLRRPGRYALLPETGVIAARTDDSDVSAQVLIDLQAALQHGSLHALQQACEGALPELKSMLRILLHYHLGSSQLRTRQVMMELQTLLP